MAGSVPGKAKGYGNLSTARNVFKVAFSKDLSSLVKYEAWDNASSFPAKDAAGATTANGVFSHGANGDPCLALVDTTNVAPASDWLDAATPVVVGENNPNRLLGMTNFVEQDGTIRVATEFIRFNMVAELSSAATTADTMAHILQLRYTYSGDAPVLTWFFNDDRAGTEGAPDWVAIVPGTNGIRHARAGAATPNYFANIPASGNELTTEGWVTV